MAKITLDLSGIGGLVERHQGDLNDTSAKPALRYLGAEAQYADGIFNPFRKLGYMAPANNSFVSLTGTVAAGINSIVYEPTGDILYFSEEGENILKLDGMDDTSLSNYLSITSGDDIKDMVLYEINGATSLIYLIDSNDTLVSGGKGMYVGYNLLDVDDYLTVYNGSVIELGTSAGSYFNDIRDTGSESGLGGQFRKLAQAIHTSDFTSHTITGVKLMLSREGGTGVGITIKVSIQANSTAAAGAFTSRGAWSNAVTDYVKNDTVTNGGFTWQCIQDHSAAGVANEEPGVGTVWEDYWNLFGAPDGSDLASNTFALSSLSDLTESTHTDADRTVITFASPLLLSADTQYWIVVEEVGSIMTATDVCSWYTTVNASGNYDRAAKGYLTAGTDIWRDININGDILTANHDNYDFVLLSDRDDFWSYSGILSQFEVETGQKSFLYVADNGLLYWSVGNKIHTLDGSLTGGPVGKANENVLQFSDYVTVADIAETRSRMHIGVQATNITSATDPRTFGASKIGIFIWDRRSQVLGGTDFYPCPGAKEIKSLFTSSDGSVKAITVGNSGFTEIRAASGNQFEVIHTFEKDGYPKSRRGVSQLGYMTVWLGLNGIFYGYGQVAPGEKDALYKLGSMAGQAAVATASLATGPIFVGNEYASGPQQAIFFGWTDTNSTEVQKWYPNGEGTLNSVLQVGQIGDVYSLVKYLPELSKVNTITVYCAPTSGTASTVIATAKIYFNQSTTVGMTKSITQAQASRGYIHWDINKPNVNAIQIEFEFNTSDALGSNDFTPSLGILDYTPTTTHTPDGG